MSQRYFLTAESTYEDLRLALNASLAYPNTLGKSVFQTALYAPRDSFRRVLLAVDTDLQGYATIDAAITPLLASDAMEEIGEATYLEAVASASQGGGGVSSWNDLTDKPSTFAPAAHKSTHAVGGSDALSPSDIGAASQSHAHSAADITSGVFDVARIPQFDVRTDTVSSTAYTGRAVSGSATSASVWKIRRAVYSSAGAVSSTATATNVKWDDRLTASYS